MTFFAICITCMAELGRSPYLGNVEKLVCIHTAKTKYSDHEVEIRGVNIAFGLFDEKTMKECTIHCRPYFRDTGCGMCREQEAITV